MSSHPATRPTSPSSVQIPHDPGRLPMTLPLLAEKKRLGDPIVMVTAYDYPSARAAEAAGVDLVLVGDSAATTVLGYNAPTPVELEGMLVLTGAPRAPAGARRCWSAACRSAPMRSPTSRRSRPRCGWSRMAAASWSSW